MNVVVIGDIGWRYLYHLGDEAMTEAAIDMLRARGIDDITLVAAQPEVAEHVYGLPAVGRVRFKAKWPRSRNEHRLTDVSRVLEEEDWADSPIYEAIRGCDAVLIAGGGNMNTRDYHLLFERVAAKRIAEHFGKPLYVSSQTVGPTLSDRDRSLVVELADYARAFGCREATTAALMRAHVEDPTRIYETLDDAAVLEADDASRESIGDLIGQRPFVAASFTNHRGTAWSDNPTYHQDVAQLCRTIADRHDVDILLIPHAGSFDSEHVQRDQLSNANIAELADDPRIRATRMVTSREDVALIERAVLSFSTRYHPTVFAPMVGTPALAIASSYYSAVRMRGSLGNVGLESFVIPRAISHLIPDAAAEAIQCNSTLATHIEESGNAAASFQHRWWDALVDSMTTSSPVEFADLVKPPSFVPSGQWAEENAERTADTDAWMLALETAHETRRELQRSEQERQVLEDRLARVSSELERYKNRKVIQLLDGRLRSRSRA